MKNGTKSPRARAHPVRRSAKKLKKPKTAGYSAADDDLDNMSYRSLSSTYSGYSNSMARLDNNRRSNEYFYSPTHVIKFYIYCLIFDPDLNRTH